MNITETRARALTSGPRSHFVGFHDIVPWDERERYILCLEADEMAPKGAPASVGLVDLRDPERPLQRVADTTAWTYHVGARQQWLKDDLFLYNAVRDGRYYGIIESVAAGPQDQIEGGIWDVGADGRWGLAPSFARSDRYYASYGFTGGTAPSLDDPAPNDDGLYLVELSTGQRTLRFSVAEIAAQVYPQRAARTPTPAWLSHPAFNPDGSRFCFYLRHYRHDGTLHSDFFVADRTVGPARCLLRGRVSHFAWLDADRLLIYARLMGRRDTIRAARAVRHPIVRSTLTLARKLKKAMPRRRGTAGGGGHLVLDVRTGATTVLAPDLLVVDGHQQFTSDRRWMVCDTYADRRRNQRLFLFDMRQKRRVELGDFPEPERLRGAPPLAQVHRDGGQNFACNLHPRWNRAGTAVCFDWADDRGRQVYMIDVSNHTRDVAAVAAA